MFNTCAKCYKINLNYALRPRSVKRPGDLDLEIGVTQMWWGLSRCQFWSS